MFHVNNPAHKVLIYFTLFLVGADTLVFLALLPENEETFWGKFFSDRQIDNHRASRLTWWQSTNFARQVAWHIIDTAGVRGWIFFIAVTSDEYERPSGHMA